MELFVAQVSEGLIPSEPELFVSKDRRDDWVREALLEQSSDTLAEMVDHAIDDAGTDVIDEDPEDTSKEQLVDALLRAVQHGAVYDEDIEVRVWVTEVDTRP